MFKKRTNLPPRPKPPTSDMLIEDLQSGADDNIFHVIMTSNNKDILIDDTSMFNNCNDKSSNPELVFEQVKTFVEINQSLKEMIKKLQSQNEILQNSNLELKLKAEEIKKQAINALK